jgi:hypothetical protein
MTAVGVAVLLVVAAETDRATRRGEERRRIGSWCF